MLAPELVEVFVTEYQAEVKRLLRSSAQGRASQQRQLQDAQRKIDGIVRAIEDGAYSAALKERLAKLEHQKAQLQTAIDSVTMPEIHLHPKLPDIYRKKVEKLEEALNSESLRDEAMALVRSLVDRIVLTPLGDGLKAELRGDLAAILAMCDEAQPKRKLPSSHALGSQLSVVAGARYPLYRTTIRWP